MCLHVCPLYHPSSFEIAQRPPRQFMNVNERGYKHLCNSAYVCVQSINPSLKIPPSPLLPPHPGGCFVVPPHFSPCSHLPLPWQQTLLCFFFFLPHRPRIEMSLLGGGGPSANKYIRAVCNHKTKHGFKKRRMTHAHTYRKFTYRSMDIIWCQQAFLHLFQTLQLLFCKDFETQLPTIAALPYYITVRVWFQSFLVIVILQAREQSTTFFCPFLCTTNKPWPFIQFSCLIR